MKKAFTFLELSVVLIVIGIIIAAVMSGRDVLTSADVKSFYQKFGGKWQTLANSYYDRMSSNIGDGTINGGTATTKDGYMDGVDVTTTVVAKMYSAGLDPCKVLKTNVTLSGYECHPGQIIVDGAGGAQQVIVHLASNGITNYVVFRNLPLDYAIALDRYTDLESNGQTGNGICFGVASNPHDMSAKVDFNTIAVGSSVDFGIALEY